MDNKIKWPTPMVTLSGGTFDLYTKDGNRPKVGDVIYHYNNSGKLAIRQTSVDRLVGVCEGNFTSASNMNMRWAETLMGLPVGWVNPNCEKPMYPNQMNDDKETYLKNCVQVDNKTDACRLLGNGVVPSCAAKAFSVLLKELNN